MEDLERVIAASKPIDENRTEQAEIRSKIKELKARLRHLKSEEQAGLAQLARIIANPAVPSPPEEEAEEMQEDDDEDDDEDAHDSADDDEPPKPKGGFRVLGGKSKTMASIAMDVLAQYEGKELSVAAIAGEGGVPEGRLDALRTALHRLQQKGAIVRSRKGYYRLDG